MADPTVLTAFIGTFAGLVGAATPIVLERRHRRISAREKEQEEEERLGEDNVASWVGLNSALGKEIGRLQGVINQQKEDYEKQLTQMRALLDQQKADYEQQMAALRNEIAALRRIIRGETT